MQSAAAADRTIDLAVHCLLGALASLDTGWLHADDFRALPALEPETFCAISEPPRQLRRPKADKAVAQVERTLPLLYRQVQVDKHVLAEAKTKDRLEDFSSAAAARDVLIVTVSTSSCHAGASSESSVLTSGESRRMAATEPLVASGNGYPLLVAVEHLVTSEQFQISRTCWGGS
eukprot:CAMPEP_0115089192 /NCGR_PEP_ID=MMETSP0227-20121206/24504_1 /TAXON_ID=89957 /ORGANISM="Polarella glacialis, Strain CCMP 1383" /LENGTH=174 /DNA_ID=CAMNT_0002479733 /DNA_START=339 /DNA_END=865 /DNA_ORIENTATION=+